MPDARKHPDDRAAALEAAAGVTYWQGDMRAAAALYDQVLERARATGDKSRIANALYNASFPKMVDHSDLVGGLAQIEEALGLFREIQDDPGIARCLWAIGNELHFERRHDDAVAPLDEAIGLFRKLGERFNLAWALHTRAITSIQHGDAAPAQVFVREALAIFAEAGDVSGIALGLDDAASAAFLAGDVERALRLAGAAAAHQVTTGAGLGTIVNREEGRKWEEVISTEGHERAWADGQAMKLEQAVAYALTPESAAKASA
jgi:tetratricopeptide (TPR) repeat protein